MPELLFSLLRPYRPQWLRGDIVAGLGQVPDVLRRAGAASVRAQPHPSIEAATAAVLGDGSPAGAGGADATGRATVRPDEMEGEQE